MNDFFSPESAEALAYSPSALSNPSTVSGSTTAKGNRAATLVFHQCDDGVWRRCVSTRTPTSGAGRRCQKRHGTLLDIARQGGGVYAVSPITRTVSAIVEDGFQTGPTSGKGRIRGFDKDGNRLTGSALEDWKERVKDARYPEHIED